MTMPIRANYLGEIAPSVMSISRQVSIIWFLVLEGVCVVDVFFFFLINSLTFPCFIKEEKATTSPC